jgi:hypothetical protein
MPRVGNLPPIWLTCGTCGETRDTPSRARHGSNWLCPNCATTNRVRRAGTADKRTSAVQQQLRDAGQLPPKPKPIPKAIVRTAAPRPAAPAVTETPPPPPRQRAPRPAIPAAAGRQQRTTESDEHWQTARLRTKPVSDLRYCELCRLDPLGDDDSPRLLAIARAYADGVTAIDLCKPHLTAADRWLTAQGRQLNLLDVIAVPRGIPRSQLTGTGRRARFAIGA